AKVLSDRVQFETWREPLAIALALMPWSDVSRLTALAADRLPGALWKLTTDAFSGSTAAEVAVLLPNEDSCEDRIGEGLRQALRAVGDVRALLGLTDRD